MPGSKGDTLAPKNPPWGQGSRKRPAGSCSVPSQLGIHVPTSANPARPWNRHAAASSGDRRAKLCPCFTPGRGCRPPAGEGDRAGGRGGRPPQRRRRQYYPSAWFCVPVRRPYNGTWHTAVSQAMVANQATDRLPGWRLAILSWRKQTRGQRLVAQTCSVVLRATNRRFVLGGGRRGYWRGSRAAPYDAWKHRWSCTPKRITYVAASYGRLGQNPAAQGSCGATSLASKKGYRPARAASRARGK